MKKTIAVLVPIMAVAAAVALGVWWWIGRERPDANAPLAFVPADTPYVLANLEPLPDEVAAVMLKQIGLQGELMTLQLSTLKDTLDKAGERGALARRAIEAVEAEHAGKTPEQALALWGLTLKARAAFYGLGLSPVLRVELAHPEAFAATLERIEARIGQSLPRGRIGEQEYFDLGLAGQPLGAVVAVIGSHLVLAPRPREASEPVLRSLLGLDRPARSLQRAKGLAALNREFGFVPSFSGYLDSRRLLAALIDAPSAPDLAAFEALAVPRPDPSPECRSEYQALAEALPRAVFGYTRLEAERADALGVLEVRRDIAAELMRLRAPMPGLAAVDADTPFNFGFSVRLATLPQVIGEFAGRVEQSPWQCPQLAFLNAGAQRARAQAGNPALFAAAPLFSGAHLLLSRLEWSPGQALPEAAGKLVVASDNPASLLAMAKGLLPDLATVDLPDDGSVVALPTPAGLPVDAPLYAARTAHAIAVALGEGEDRDLPGFLAGDEDEQPLLVAGATGAFYANLADLSLRALPEDADLAQRARAEREAARLREIYTALFRRMELRLDLTERGIELRDSVLMPHRGATTAAAP